MKQNDKILCPSSKCKSGSELLGVRQDDGTVAILPQTLPIDETFMHDVRADGVNPEQKFRFVNKCVECGCKQWTGKSCGVIDNLVTYLDNLPVADALPPCSIRSQCRWYKQQGADACKVCKFVVTEVTEQDEPMMEETV